MPELKDIAEGKLATRESLIREIQAAVKAQLGSAGLPGDFETFDGPLGEQIAIAAGGIYVANAMPDHIAEGICNWLDRYFLQSPQDFGPRAETAGSPSSGVPPKDVNGGGDGSSRVAASTIHLPHLIAHEFAISSSEARRLVQQGGVAINGERVAPEDVDIDPGRVHGAVLRIGRRRGKRIDLGRAA